MSATGQPVTIPSAGTTLKYANVGSSPSTTAGPIRKYDNLPDVKVDTYETTQVDAVKGDGSPDLEKYFAFGKTDNGELAYTIGGSATVIGTLYGLKGIMKAWGLTFSDTTTITFSGGITGVKFAVGEKDEFLVTITIKVSGGITITPPAGSGRKAVTIFPNRALPASTLTVDGVLKAVSESLVEAGAPVADIIAALAQKPADSLTLESVLDVVSDYLRKADLPIGGVIAKLVQKLISAPSEKTPVETPPADPAAHVDVEAPAGKPA